MDLPAIRLPGAAAAESSHTAELIRHTAVGDPSACMFMHRSHTWEHAHMPRSARLRRLVGLAVAHADCGRTCPREGVGAAQCVRQSAPADHAPDQSAASALGIPATVTKRGRAEDPRTTGTAWVV